MTGRLLRSLRKLGVLSGDSRTQWRRVLLFRNFTVVPARPGMIPFGFKFIVLDDAGEPAWFGRCGWATPDAMEYECRILDALTRDPLSREHTPESRALLDGPNSMQVSRSLGRIGYNRILTERSADQWIDDCRQVLLLSEQLMARLESGILQHEASVAMSRRREQFAADLRTVCDRGIGKGLGEQLAVAYEKWHDELPVRVQHGDLWPANILYSQNRWWLIDFSECGMVWCPGYDLLLLLSNGPDGFSTSWIAPDGSHAGKWQSARARILKDFMERHHLGRAAMGALLLQSMLRITSYRLRPGLSSHLAAPWLNGLSRILAIWSTHGDFASILPD